MEKKQNRSQQRHHLHLVSVVVAAYSHHPKFVLARYLSVYVLSSLSRRNSHSIVGRLCSQFRISFSSKINDCSNFV